MKANSFLLVLLAALCIGCAGSSNPMVGNWIADTTKPPMKDMPEAIRPKVNVQFKDDGSFTFTVKRGEQSDEIAGKYKLEGDKVTMTPVVENGKATKEKPITVTLDKEKRSFQMPDGAGTIVKQ